MKRISNRLLIQYGCKVLNIGTVGKNTSGSTSFNLPTSYASTNFSTQAINNKAYLKTFIYSYTTTEITVSFRNVSDNSYSGDLNCYYITCGY